MERMDSKSCSFRALADCIKTGGEQNPKAHTVTSYDGCIGRTVVSQTTPLIQIFVWEILFFKVVLTFKYWSLNHVQILHGPLVHWVSSSSVKHWAHGLMPNKSRSTSWYYGDGLLSSLTFLRALPVKGWRQKGQWGSRGNDTLLFSFVWKLSSDWRRKQQEQNPSNSEHQRT
jgi:hypothetical protein